MGFSSGGRTIFGMNRKNPADAGKHLFKDAPQATQALHKQSRAERRAKARKAWHEANRQRLGGAL